MLLLLLLLSLHVFSHIVGSQTIEAVRDGPFPDADVGRGKKTGYDAVMGFQEICTLRL